MILRTVLLSIVLSSMPAYGFLPSIPTIDIIRESISNNKKTVYSLAGATVLAGAAKALFATDVGSIAYGDPRYYWDWHTIDTDQITFDKDFLFGVGTSAYQVEGKCFNTDWYNWEQGAYKDGQPHVQDQCDLACDHWNKYKEDIDLLDKIGAGIYRFSLAWDKIQPTPDTFDEQAINHYKEVCKELAQRGIKAHIGFHHYTDPKWFADLGGFEREDNIHFFVDYCAKVIDAFNKDNVTVELWSTFNSPTGYAFHKYHTGDFPPGITGDKQLTLTVLKNMMEAHVQTYQACKALNPHARIGILKNIMQIEPWRPWHPMDNFACSIANRMMDTCIFKFFTTGHFVAKIPHDQAAFMAHVEHTNASAPQCLDFIGLNYYSHNYLKNMKRMVHPHEILTDNPHYTIYPEGLYRAIEKITNQMVTPIKELTAKQVPIYVTENGAALKEPTAKQVPICVTGIASLNEQHRKIFFKRYLYALHKAKQDGYDVRGYIYWSFMDNYEWGTYDKKYGLVHVNFDKQSKDYLKRSVKIDAGTDYYITLMRTQKLFKSLST